MTDSLIYKCDDISCFWNYGQACTSVQISLDEKHKCIVYIFRELAEEAILANMKAKIKTQPEKSSPPPSFREITPKLFFREDIEK